MCPARPGGQARGDFDRDTAAFDDAVAALFR
jgi:hypothetical protein